MTAQKNVLQTIKEFADLPAKALENGLHVSVKSEIGTYAIVRDDTVHHPNGSGVLLVFIASLPPEKLTGTEGARASS